jgi:isopenicillin-N epimerase
VSEPSRRRFVEQLAGASTALAAAPYWRGLTQDDEAGWRAVRAEFLFEERAIPMNAANMCPPPRAVVAAVEQANRSVDADISFHNRAQYQALRETVRVALARFLDGIPDEFAIVRNASEGNNIVVAGLELASGDEVLITDQNHASNGLAWEQRAARQGFSVVRVTLPARPESEDELIRVIRDGMSPRTRVLAFSDVANGTGLRLPVAALCRLARERSIHVHVDGAQSLGAMRLSLRELGCDSYTASTQKWLMGPREAGLLYVRQDRIGAIWPSVVSRGFSDPGDPDPRSAKKLETLGQRNEGVLAGLAAAIGFVEQLGIDRVAARVVRLAERLKAGLTGLPGYRLVTPADPALSLGIVIGRFEGLDHQRLHDRLYREHRIASAPTGGLRLCPHIYNSLADLDRVVRAVDAARRGG